MSCVLGHPWTSILAAKGSTGAGHDGHCPTETARTATAGPDTSAHRLRSRRRADVASPSDIQVLVRSDHLQHFGQRQLFICQKRVMSWAKVVHLRAIGISCMWTCLDSGRHNWTLYDNRESII